MKKLFKTIIISIALINILPIMFGTIINAQAPQSIPYQAVARDASGNLIAATTVKLRFTIHDATANGATVYQESRSATTNALGLFSVNIGSTGATDITGTFSTISWGSNAKFMQVEIDLTNGNTFTDMGTQQMMSVPYALYASGTPGSIIPFVSPFDFGLSTDLSGLPDLVGAVGISNSSNLPLNGGLLYLTGYYNSPLPLSRNGTITSVAANFKANQGSVIALVATIYAQVYSAAPTSDVFFPIPGALVILYPGLTGIVAPDTFCHGIATGLSIPVTAESRLLIVFSLSATGIGLAYLQGFGSGSITLQ